MCSSERVKQKQTCGIGACVCRCMLEFVADTLQRSAMSLWV